MFPHVSETEVGKSPYWLLDLKLPIFVLTVIPVSVGKKESGGGSSAGSTSAQLTFGAGSSFAG